MVANGKAKIRDRFSSRLFLVAFLTLGQLIAVNCVYAQSEITTDIFPFDLATPDLNEKLPGQLDEISGLAAIDDSTIVAVQDERGYLYFLDARSGKLRDRVRFASSGDYEGIALAGDVLYVLRSDGDLYRVTEWQSDDPQTNKIETLLSGRFDTEGLEYDAANRRLLIACKEYPGRRLKGFRSVYAFSLETNELIRQPVFAVNYDAKMRSEYPARLSEVVEDKDNRRDFKPSAIAIENKTGHVYILSSVWKALVILSADGNLVSVVELDPDRFRQPEGLAFDASGNLYISSEAAGKKARLFRYNRIK
ncbi:MAG: hypothetical protein HKN43_07910 [Rhodothermales bacterium]|nr:hypothetical protein [Rhodothermales bacterium]